MKFEEALALMRQGKKVRRICVPNILYSLSNGVVFKAKHLDTNTSTDIFYFTTNYIITQDWEEYNESKTKK